MNCSNISNLLIKNITNCQDEGYKPSIQELIIVLFILICTVCVVFYLIRFMDENGMPTMYVYNIDDNPFYNDSDESTNVSIDSQNNITFDSSIKINTNFKTYINEFENCNFDENKDYTCAICLQYSEDLEELELECGHKFHKICLDTWFDFNNEKSCPLCKRSFDYN